MRWIGSRAIVLLLTGMLLLPSIQAVMTTPLGPPESAFSSPEDPKLLESLEAEFDSTQSTGVVVHLSHDTSFQDRKALAEALRAAGAPDAHALQLQPAVTATVGPSVLPVLREHPQLTSVTVPQPAVLAGSTCDPNSTAPPDSPWWFGESTRLGQAQDLGIDGDGVVAVLDTGVHLAHPDLDDNYLGNDADVGHANAWFDPYGGSASPVDECGHGTAVTGTAVGENLGAAPGASWVGARVGNNNVPLDNVVAAFEWVLTDLPADAHPDVLVGSWGWGPGELSETDQGLLHNYIRMLRENGTLPVFAAGNTDMTEPSTVDVPADFLNAVAVNSLTPIGTRDGAIGPSRHGPGGVNLAAGERIFTKPDLTVPGVGLVAPLPNGSSADYRWANGTSFAAPLAAGIALLTEERFPGLDVDQVERTLLAASNVRHWEGFDPDTDTRPNNDTGFGVTNAMLSVNLPQRSRNVLIVGDYDQTYKTVLEQSGYRVTQLRPRAYLLPLVEQLTISHGTVMLGNLPETFEESDADTRLFQLLRGSDVGVVAISDPGPHEWDGLQVLDGALTNISVVGAEQKSAGEVNVSVTESTAFTQNYEEGAVFKMREAKKTNNGKAPYNLDLLEGSGSTWFGVGNDASEGAPSWAAVPRNSFDNLSDSRTALLANVGASGVNPPSELTGRANTTLVDAVEWVRSGPPAPRDVPVNVLEPIDNADVVVVGDPSRQVSSIVSELGYTLRAVPAWDFALLNATFSTNDHSVRAIIYANVTRDTGTGPTLADVEEARQSLFENVPAIVLGGGSSLALERLQSHLGYTLGSGSTTELVTIHPHAVNDYAPEGTTTSLREAARTVQPVSPSAWLYPYNASTSGPAVVAVQESDSDRPQAAVLGFGSSSGRTLTVEEQEILSRTIDWATRHIQKSAIVLEGDHELNSSNLFQPSTGPDDAHVLNGYNFEDVSLEIRNTTFDLNIRNSGFDGSTSSGLVLMNNTGEIRITGNYFSNKNPAVFVEASPNVEIHNNIFNKNAVALNTSLTPSNILASTPIDATYNYFYPVDSGQINNGNVYWFLPYLLDFVVDGPEDNRNRINPLFQVVPFYTQEDRSEVFPADGRGYLADRGATTSSFLVPQGPLSEVRFSYPAGRSFDFSVQDEETGDVLSTVSVDSPDGWLSKEVSDVSTGFYGIEATSDWGRGDFYTSTVPDTVPRTFNVLEYEPFTDTTTNWKLDSTTVDAASPGADGTTGLLRFSSLGGEASWGTEADLHGLSIVSYLQFTGDTTEARLSALTEPNATTPAVDIRFTPDGTQTDGWPRTSTNPRLEPGSWHKVEVRVHPPFAQVYVDNHLVGTAPAFGAPVAPGMVAPTEFVWNASDGSVVLDEIRILRGEPVPGLLLEKTFEEDVEDLIYKITGQDDQVLLVDGTNSTTMDPDTTIEVLASGSTPQIDSDFAMSGGSPSYKNGESVYVESDGNSASVMLPLPGNRTRYAFEEYISIPENQAFRDFALLELRDEQNRTLVRVGLEDNNTFLDVRGGEYHPNVANLTTPAWHKLAVLVEGPNYVVLLDDTPVVEGTLTRSGAPADLWFLGKGLGAILFDNLRYGGFPTFDADPSADANIDAEWSVETTSSTSGVVETVDQVPKSSATGNTESPLLASHTLRLNAPSGEESVTHLSRSLPANGGDREVRMSFYLPPDSPLRPAYDAFHLFRLDDGNNLAYSILLRENNLYPEVNRRGHGESTLDFNLTRGVWHTVTAEIAADGGARVWIDGKELPQLPPGPVPSQLRVGDFTNTVDLVAPGNTGSGTVYIDDVLVLGSNQEPITSWNSPLDADVIGGLWNLKGNAEDSDQVDAVSTVFLNLSQSSSTLWGPTKALGTTSWSRTLNTTHYPHGVYTLTSSATDNVNRGLGAPVDVTIDNRPVGGIDSPADGSSIGGIVSVEGTSNPRFPISPNEGVDEARYRIDGGNWTQLTVENGSWQLTWDTRPETKGSHTVTVEADKWLDTSRWTATYAVDNSPAIDFTAPADTSTLGGVVQFGGTVTDRYIVGENDTVDDAWWRVDGGPWVSLNLTPVGDGVETWNVTVDTHLLSKGWHKISIRGAEDGDNRTASLDFRMDNTPTLKTTSPTRNVEAGDIFVVRGWTQDQFPHPDHPFPENITVFVDGGPGQDVQILDRDDNGTLWWKFALDTRGLTQDEWHDVEIRASDGQDSTAVTRHIYVRNGDPLSLDDNTVRFDYLRGAGDGDRYEFTLPTDVTRLYVRYDAYVDGSNGTMYLRSGGNSTNTTHDFESTGNGTVEVLDLDTLDGIGGGDYSLLVEAAGNATDHRLELWWNTLDSDGGDGGGDCPTKELSSTSDTNVDSTC